MNIYKVTGKEEVACFKTDIVFYTADEVIKYAIENGIVQNHNGIYEAFSISAKEYADFLSGQCLCTRP
ncbi:MAG: hypothetical protein K5664_07030 [Firmicutes bacterium]|nr:hypothetical protein [Bacillota bacterium]